MDMSSQAGYSRIHAVAALVEQSMSMTECPQRTISQPLTHICNKSLQTFKKIKRVFKVFLNSLNVFLNFQQVKIIQITSPVSGNIGSVLAIKTTVFNE